jgi:hypothetical protein
MLVRSDSTGGVDVENALTSPSRQSSVLGVEVYVMPKLCHRPSITPISLQEAFVLAVALDDLK